MKTISTTSSTNTNPKRRQFLRHSAGFALIAGAAATLGKQAFATAEGNFPVQKTAAQWREQLTPAQYAVLREEDTERAYTSAHLNEKRDGVFHCAGCDNALYDNATKFESGTGWPSFCQALDGAVGTKEDNSWLMTRTEVHCADCGGHLGHIFNDGPEPTGKRHCINGVALTFKAAVV